MSITLLDPIKAQLTCTFCREEIGRLGIIVDQNVRMDPKCAARVRDVINASLKPFEVRR